MTKTEFDAALDRCAEEFMDTDRRLDEILASHGLRIVPSEPVAFWDGDRSEPGIAFAPNVFDKIPFYADPEDSK